LAWLGLAWLGLACDPAFVIDPAKGAKKWKFNKRSHHRTWMGV